MSKPASATSDKLRHVGGFLLAGGLAFLTDVGILEALTRFAGLSPFTGLPRLISASKSPVFPVSAIF